MKKLSTALLILLIAAITACTDSGNELLLHVQSPDWSEQIIYFIMIDRFNDGDPTNNDQGMNEFDPTDSRKFSGGDLQGIIDQLDYIQSLGATAIWITPPVANQWWNPGISYGGYHGYWAIHFEEVDAHFGTLETYKQLSSELHKRGMYLIQDIVTNHTGDFFYYKPEYDPADPARNVHRNTGSVPTEAPIQSPFDMNDVLNAEHRAANIFHWTPDINQYNAPYQRLHYQLSGLDDLNTANPVVRDALKRAYSFWIKEVGVDGYRIDTVIYCEHDFWHEFIHSTDSTSPGLDWTATSTGRNDFLTFGEAFIGADPYDDGGDREVAAYIGSSNKPEMDAVLSFPLHFSIKRVFAQGMPSGYLGYRLNTLVNSDIYPNPFIVPHFLDNHDVQRFLSSADTVALEQALLLIHTIPGIPVIWQGTEQLFKKTRRAMFAAGVESGGIDHFNRDAEIYMLIRALADLRKNHKVLTHGDLSILQDSPVAPGVLAYRRQLEDENVIVIFNTADQPILMSSLNTGLPPYTELNRIAGWELPESLPFDNNGFVTVELPPRAAGVFIAGERLQYDSKVAPPILLNTTIHNKTFSTDFAVSGTVRDEIDSVSIVIDGKLSTAIKLPVAGDKSFNTTFSLKRFPFGKSQHTLSIYAPGVSAASPTQTFFTDVPERGIFASTADPQGDDTGPTGNYKVPQDASFGGQMDILAAEVTAFGGNLKLTLQMDEVSDVWLPPNGFDHVLFSIFLDMPDRKGASQLPLLNASAPGDFEWNYMFRAAGWSTSFVEASNDKNASSHEVVTPSPTIEVDKENKTITFTFVSEAFKYPETLSGTRLYITTWDGSEGRLRPLNPEGAAYEFGGAAADSPKILDDTEIIVIP